MICQWKRQAKVLFSIRALENQWNEMQDERCGELCSVGNFQLPARDSVRRSRSRNDEQLRDSQSSCVALIKLSH
jgi:hypothetical protein